MSAPSDRSQEPLMTVRAAVILMLGPQVAVAAASGTQRRSSTRAGTSETSPSADPYDRPGGTVPAGDSSFSLRVEPAGWRVRPESLATNQQVAVAVVRAEPGAPYPHSVQDRRHRHDRRASLSSAALRSPSGTGKQHSDSAPAGQRIKVSQSRPCSHKAPLRWSSLSTCESSRRFAVYGVTTGPVDPPGLA